MKINTLKTGFTLIELMVVISIIGLLSAIVYANFNDARAQARDKVRMSALKEVQLALEFYKAQNGSYPNTSLVGACGGGVSDFFGNDPDGGSAGFVNCRDYIPGLVPDFISVLPTDPNQEIVANKGYYYKSNGLAYKLMAYNVVEQLPITGAGDEFSRCPSASGACASGVPATTYAVYSIGAETW